MGDSCCDGLRYHRAPVTSHDLPGAEPNDDAQSYSTLVQNM